MKTLNRYTLVASALVPVGVLVLILIVQDQRQGWPFSRYSAQGPLTAQPVQISQDPERLTTASARAAVELPDKQVAMIGVQYEPVQAGTFDDPVDAVATVVADESRIVHVHTRVAGWLEELGVNTTGEYVRAGQALGAVFSQELYSSQIEYLSALRRTGDGPPSAIVEAARTRLLLFGMSDAEIAGVAQSGEVRRLITITAPASGVVLNRGVTQGTAVDPSTEILTLADLSQVWVIAEVAEADAARVRAGSQATLNFPLSGREPFTSSIQFVYPTLTERSRTVRVRMSVPNTDGLLRPGMYGSASFPLVPREALTVGRDAVVDTGQTQHVFVHTADNIFEPRQVKVGARRANRVEILSGLAAGDHVVTAGVFLLDSESRLRASGGTGHAGHGVAPEQPARPDEPQQHEH